MSDKRIGEQLLDRSSSDEDPHMVARQIVARDRSYSRLLTAGVVLLWLIATGLLFPLIAELRTTAGEFETTMRDVIASTDVNSELPDRLSRLETVYSNSAAVSVFLMMLAAICTLLLVSTSRRTTLRQVNANLMEISRQIAQLKTPTKSS